MGRHLPRSGFAGRNRPGETSFGETNERHQIERPLGKRRAGVPVMFDPYEQVRIDAELVADERGEVLGDVGDARAAIVGPLSHDRYRPAIGERNQFQIAVAFASMKSGIPETLVNRRPARASETCGMKGSFQNRWGESGGRGRKNEPDYSESHFAKCVKAQAGITPNALQKKSDPDGPLGCPVAMPMDPCDCLRLILNKVEVQPRVVLERQAALLAIASAADDHKRRQEADDLELFGQLPGIPHTSEYMFEFFFGPRAVSLHLGKGMRGERVQWGRNQLRQTWEAPF